MDNQDQNCRYMTFIWTLELEFPKHWENKYDCLLFWADLFTSFKFYVFTNRNIFT